MVSYIWEVMVEIWVYFHTELLQCQVAACNAFILSYYRHEINVSQQNLLLIINSGGPNLQKSLTDWLIKRKLIKERCLAWIVSLTSSALIWASCKIKNGQLLLFSTATTMIPWPLITVIKLTGSKFIVFNGLLYIQHKIWAGTVCYIHVSVSYPNGLQGMCCHIKLFDYLLQVAHAILCRKSSPEERAWSLFRVLITIASSNGIFFVGCNMLFIKDWPQHLVVRPTKIWTVLCFYRVKTLFLPSPGFLAQGSFVYTAL